MSTTIRKVFEDFKGVLGLSGWLGQGNRGTGTLYWENIPYIAARQRLRETGSEPERYKNLLDYAIKRWGSRLPSRKLSVLAIGCSHKLQLPQMLLETGRVGNVLVVDSDSAALENIHEQNLQGVECWQMDLNSDPLPRGPFDVIACWDSLNYIRDIAHIGAEIEKVLDRSGLFVAREYIGPDRLQYSPQQMRLVNAYLRYLPENLRFSSEDGKVVNEQVAPDTADMLRIAPQKAICSEQIEKMIYLRMRMMEEIPLGGSLMAPLLANIGENFKIEDKETCDLLDCLMDVEMRMIEGGIIQSDYKAYIARLY